MEPTVIVRDLTKRYGATEAVRGVSFEVNRGEVFGLLGPNGAGKTTTVECLIGLREPDGGELRVCGIDGRRRAREVKQRIGVALQSTALQDAITPREALRLFGSFYDRRVDAAALLARFGLGEKADARFGTLSGGQRQRLALALAFVNSPEVVVLDEPTTGLDPQSRRELHGDIARMRADGCTVLLTTHYLEEAEQLCDRVAIIDQGRIVATGVPRELMARGAAEQSVVLATNPVLPAERLAALAGVAGLEVAANGVATFRTRDAAATLAAVATLVREQGVELVELRVRKASLEDVFLALTRSDEAEVKA